MLQAVDDHAWSVGSQLYHLLQLVIHRFTGTAPEVQTLNVIQVRCLLCNGKLGNRWIQYMYVLVLKIKQLLVILYFVVKLFECLITCTKHHFEFFSIVNTVM